MVADATIVSDAVAQYLSELSVFRLPQTVENAAYILNKFAARMTGRLISGVTRHDVLQHMAHLKGTGLSDRTIYNHVVRINALLRSHNKFKILETKYWPRYEEKEVTPYTDRELASLFAAATPEERILFQFFLATGFASKRSCSVHVGMWTSRTK